MQIATITSYPVSIAGNWNPGSEAEDAFTVDWADENNCLCPPVTLIPRVINHAVVCKAVGTLIVPCWPSAPFWPLLHPVVGKFAGFVTAVQELPLSGSTWIVWCKFV